MSPPVLIVHGEPDAAELAAVVSTITLARDATAARTEKAKRTPASWWHGETGYRPPGMWASFESGY